MADIDLVSLARKALEGSQTDDGVDVTDDAGEQVGEQEDSQAAGSPAGEPTKTAESAAGGLRDFLKNEFQYDLGDDVADKDLYPQVGNLIRERQKLVEEMDALRRTAAELQEMSQRPVTAELKTKAEEAGDVKGGKGWRPLDYDPEWERAAEFDPETRQWIGKAKYTAWGAEAARQLNDYYRQQTERARRLTSDPLTVVREAGLDDYLAGLKTELKAEIEAAKKAASEEFQRSSTQTRVTGELDQFFETHKAEYFKLDSKGNVLKDPMSGRYATTQKGDSYIAAAEEARRDFGIEDPMAVHRYALRVTGAPTAKGSAPPAPPASEPKKPAKEKNVEQKKKFLERGAMPAQRPGNRDGSLESARERGEPQNDRLSFADMVLTDPDNAELLGRSYRG